MIFSVRPATDSAGWVQRQDATVTRESKLALVIGITLVLLVGVLISDHLSGATGAQFDAPAQPVAAAKQPLAPLADDFASLQPRPAPMTTEPVASSVWASEDAIANAPITDDRPVEISQGSGILENAFDRLRGMDMPELRIEIPEGFERVDDRARTVPPGSRSTGQPLKPVPDEGSRVPSFPPAAEPMPSYRTHTVVAGDSLYALARTYLGDGNRWTELQKLNADVLGGGETLKVGMVLKIDRRTTAEPAPRTRPRSSSDKPLREYVVLKGDNLGTIAQKLLGSSKRMREIVELNGLKDPDDIRVGQSLKIPHK
ncbi:MAG: LysM peptidoglycan-binding domain-containing protein [Planctomycetota bacterium]|nr:MAG: LysM peptidoglycan-binding domain-containing protein [Planctomycetota bacterium]